LHLADHVFQVGEQLWLLKTVLCRNLGQKLPIGFGDPDDLNLWTVAKLLEKSMYMSVNQTDNSNPQWARTLPGRGSPEAH
jgi:hypothetical protein